MELFLKKVENAFGIKSLHLNLENDKKMYKIIGVCVKVIMKKRVRIQVGIYQ